MKTRTNKSLSKRDLYQSLLRAGLSLSNIEHLIRIFSRYSALTSFVRTIAQMTEKEYADPRVSKKIFQRSRRLVSL